MKSFLRNSASRGARPRPCPWSSWELLDKQTRELRDAQRTELAKATAQMKAEQKSLFAGVDQQLKEHKEDMQTIKSAHSDLEKRLSRLEQSGVSTAPTSSGLGDNKPAVLVFGGWGTGARTSLVLQELEASLKEIRKGVALAEFAVRDAETRNMRNRMPDITKTVSEADT